MGLTGELVRSVFSKNRSFGSQDSNVRSYGVDRRKWTSVRSYLCGDEFNSVLAEDDSASIRSSEATVTGPIAQDWRDDVEIQSENKEEKVTVEKHNSLTRLLTKEKAANVIQSAFRRFLAKRQEGKEVCEIESGFLGLGSPSRESMATSIEVQTGGSVEIFTVQEESLAFQHRMQQKARAQAYRLKEDWDDSTVSSNISQMRIQNRLEATTRRERALAYAFSQQLRICSKKKPSRSDTFETNLGWSWLERWMATRIPDNASVEDRMSSRFEPISSDRKAIVTHRNFDVGVEEKESCGSNEASAGTEALTITEPSVNGSYTKPVKNKLKATKTVSRRKTVPSYQCSSQSTKVSKKEFSMEAEKDKKQKQTQGSASEVKCKNGSSQTLSVSETNISS